MAEKTYCVVKPFQDRQGRQWQPDEDFEGDKQAIQEALAQGNIREDQEGQQSQRTGQQGQQTGQAPKR